MTTAVDANVLLDILLTGSEFYETSKENLWRAGLQGPVILGEAVWAEIASRFEKSHEIEQFLDLLGIAYWPSSLPTLHMAGKAFAAWTRTRGGFRCSECGSAIDVNCARCGSPVTRRQYMLPDFMIGAHAQIHAGRLLTRDRGYYRTYFPDLVLV